MAEAVAILRERDLWDHVPESIRRHLAGPGAESPSFEREPQTVLLVTGRSACEAMALEAQAAGAEAHVVSSELEGEARELGRMLAAMAHEDGDGKMAMPRVLIGCGGEATVSLGRDTAFGDGGPNQEAAVAAALALGEGAAVSARFLDTDGSDGGTAAAGGIVDGHTVARAARAEIDLEAALAGHRCGEALAELGDRIVTGPTQTNVNDLFVIAAGPAGAAPV